MNHDIRVRIAPSPTGWLHVGTARSALFNFLFARHYGGKFVLRIEDTDQERSDEKYYKDIIAGLKWLNIAWDEGPDIDGPYSPYRQSEREKYYRPAIATLVKENKAYYCYCTKEELENERQKQKEAGQPPLYSGQCRDLTEQDAKAQKKTNSKPIIRFRTPNENITFHDLIRGPITTATATLGDFSIAKNISTPLYNLAVVLDDIGMNISHVIRGEDHIANTPKQILLFRALSQEPPQFAHLTLILNEDRSKLSKRKNETSLLAYKKMGYLPEAIVNFIALLGWNPKTTQEIFSLQELIEQFDLKKINRAGAIFDRKKLDWLNSQYLKKLPPEKFLEMCRPYLKEKKLSLEFLPKETLEKILHLEQDRIKTLAEVGDDVHFFFQEPEYSAELLLWKKMTKTKTRESLERSHAFLQTLAESDFTTALLEQRFRNYITENKLQTGEALWPLRVALSGQQHSPSPFEILAILDREQALKRIKKAILLLLALS